MIPFAKRLVMPIKHVYLVPVVAKRITIWITLEPVCKVRKTMLALLLTNSELSYRDCYKVFEASMGSCPIILLLPLRSLKV